MAQILQLQAQGLEVLVVEPHHQVLLQLELLDLQCTQMCLAMCLVIRAAMEAILVLIVVGPWHDAGLVEVEVVLEVLEVLLQVEPHQADKVVRAVLE